MAYLLLDDYGFLSEVCGECKFYELDSEVKEIGERAFAHAFGVRRVVIPSTVKKIGKNAFSNCKYLSVVIIKNGVESIGEGAFEGCDSLASIVIPDSVKTIGKNVFKDCKQLTEVVIGNGVKEIPTGAFSGCSNLTKVVIGNKVESLGFMSFLNCCNIAQMILPKTLKDASCSILCFKEGNTQSIVYYLGSFDEWQKIKIAGPDDEINKYMRCYYKETNPYENDCNCEISYWHYDVDGEPRRWYID